MAGSEGYEPYQRLCGRMSWPMTTKPYAIKGQRNRDAVESQRYSAGGLRHVR